MALPKYDKSKRKKQYEILPKGAYVVKIMNAVEKANKNNSGSYIEISFDIAEGEYKDFYADLYRANTNEDKKWSNDAIFRLSVPNADSQEFIIQNYHNFFGDLADSNNDFEFVGDLKSLRNKVIGGKFHIEQTEYNGEIYDHTRMKWTCVADDVRNGKPGKMPNDKLITVDFSKPTAPTSAGDDFMKIPEGVDVDELPFG